MLYTFEKHSQTIVVNEHEQDFTKKAKKGQTIGLSFKPLTTHTYAVSPFKVGGVKSSASQQQVTDSQRGFGRLLVLVNEILRGSKEERLDGWTAR